jgi:K+-sensing histidine kinase KdpD
VSPTRPAPAATSAGHFADDLLGTLLHDLHTPLAVMNGWSRMLQQQYAEQADEFMQRGLTQLTKYAAAQTALLARVNDFCELWNGPATLARDRVDLFDLARVALHAQQSTATQCGVAQALHTEAPEGLVAGDFGRLRQMVRDLLACVLESTSVGRRLQVHGALTEQHVVLTLHDVAASTDEPRLVHAIDDRRSGIEAPVERRLTFVLARGLVALHGGVLAAAPRLRDDGASLTLRMPRLGMAPVRNDDDSWLEQLGAGH